MKKILAASIFVLTSFSFAQTFEPEYDETTHYISNMIDWSEYEMECIKQNRDPVYEDYEYKYGGHCDFETIEAEGIDIMEETYRLFAEVEE